MSSRPPYSGTDRKLVLALDIGTTFSGISYCILDPGQVPEIKGVTRFPAQEQVGGASKIPTIIYYNQDGEVCAVGEEAAQEGLGDKAEDEGWIKAEWFKLHLRPSSVDNLGHRLPPLPENKSIIEIFGDFMSYLYMCARTYIRDTYPNGADLLASVEQNTEFILSHPNGWEGAQQDQLRKAAVFAGLIPNTNEGHARIHFVTEGEASLHFCIQSGLTIDAGQGVMVVDVGGGTIDLSAYGQTSASREYSFQEIAPSQCHFQGSVFVKNYARAFMQDYLKNSRFIEDVEHITNCFDKTTKLRFRNIKEPQYIKFGTNRDKDPALNIRSGQLKLMGTDVAKFFLPSIQCIIKAVLELRECALKPISSIFLVGGFAASDWLFSQLKDSLEPLGVDFCRPDSHVNKAVADGAVSFYIDHSVSARISKFAYGIKYVVYYDATDNEHLRRSSISYSDPSGVTVVPNGFSIILPKNTQVYETTEFREPYVHRAQQLSEFGSEIGTDIICYRGASSHPKWMDVEGEMYTVLCTVVTDVSDVRNIIQLKHGTKGQDYHELAFEIVLSFGLTELTAQISWKENGQEKRCPAKIVYDYSVEEKSTLSPRVDRII